MLQTIRTIGFLIAAFLLSLLVGYVVAIPLAIQFDAREEFIGVMVALNLFAIAVIVILSIVFALSSRTRLVGLAAGIVAGATLLLVGGILILSLLRNRTKTIPIDELQIAAEFLLPALSIVVVQWWMVRRRRLTTLMTTRVE